MTTALCPDCKQNVPFEHVCEPRTSKERCKHLQQPPFGDGCHFTVLAGPMICPWCEIERLQRELEVRDLAVKTAAHGLGELFRENNALRASHEPEAQRLRGILRNIGECISGHDGHVFDDVHALLEQSSALAASPPPPAPAPCDHEWSAVRQLHECLKGCGCVMSARTGVIRAALTKGEGQ